MHLKTFPWLSCSRNGRNLANLSIINSFTSTDKPTTRANGNDLNSIGKANVARVALMDCVVMNGFRVGHPHKWQFNWIPFRRRHTINAKMHRTTFDPTSWCTQNGYVINWLIDRLGTARWPVSGHIGYNYAKQVKWAMGLVVPFSIRLTSVRLLRLQRMNG